jgi:hypothetical protein
MVVLRLQIGTSLKQSGARKAQITIPKRKSVRLSENVLMWSHHTQNGVIANAIPTGFYNVLWGAFRWVNRKKDTQKSGGILLS